MRKSLPASASVASESGLPASARAPMSAMTWSHALPTTAIPETTALLHISSLLSQSSTILPEHTRARRAKPCPSRSSRTVGDRLSRCSAPRAGRSPAPPSSPPFCLFRAFVSSFLLLLFVIWPTPLRALDFDGRPDRIAGASATSALPRPSPCPGPAAAAAEEAASPCARVETTLPPPVPSPNSREHVIIHASRPTYPTHVSIHPWA